MRNRIKETERKGKRSSWLEFNEDRRQKILIPRERSENNIVIDHTVLKSTQAKDKEEMAEFLRYWNNLDVLETMFNEPTVTLNSFLALEPTT